MQHMDNHGYPSGAAASQNADGVWHNLKPVPSLWAADVAVPEGQSACVVVQQGQMAWVGPEAQLSGAYQALPRHDARGHTKLHQKRQQKARHYKNRSCSRPWIKRYIAFWP